MGGIQKQYTEVLRDLLQTGMEPKDAVKKLQALMERRGHVRVLPSVIKAAVRELTRRDVRAPRLTLARESDLKQFKELAKEAEVTLDESLIGGYILQKEGKQTNNSYKNKLLTWYRQSIA